MTDLILAGLLLIGGFVLFAAFALALEVWER